MGKVYEFLSLPYHTLYTMEEIVKYFKDLEAEGKIKDSKRHIKNVDKLPEKHTYVLPKNAGTLVKLPKLINYDNQTTSII